MKAQHVQVHNIIKQNNTSNVMQSPIQPKKQDRIKSSGDGHWRRHGKGGVRKHQGRQVMQQGGLLEIKGGGSRTPLPTMLVVLGKNCKERFYNLSNLSLIGYFWSLSFFFEVLLPSFKVLHPSKWCIKSLTYC